MVINYTNDAFASLIHLVNFIEDTNTIGAGVRWLSRFEEFLIERLKNPQQIKLCNNITFNKLDLRCIYFNDWLIALTVYEDFTLIEAILHKSRITD